MTYRINGKLVTQDEWDSRSKVGITPGKAPMGFARQPFVSPIDGSVISSAADLSRHEREHNVVQVGNEYVSIVNEKREAAKEARYKKKVQDDYNFKWE